MILFKNRYTEPVYKPSFVHPDCPGLCGHSPGPGLAVRFTRSTRLRSSNTWTLMRTTSGDYLILHRVGFTSPRCRKRSWWSLTPPFHPYPDTSVGAVLFLLHFPYPRGFLPLGGTLFCGARTFLPDKSGQPPDRLSMSNNYQN